MSTHVETICKTKRYGTISHNSERAQTELDIGKEKWLQKYSRRLLRSWHQWQTPLGVASAYAEKIRDDLAEFYDDPLKRMFIEATYC